jgi:hypothetical protein
LAWADAKLLAIEARWDFSFCHAVVPAVPKADPKPTLVDA